MIGSDSTVEHAQIMSIISSNLNEIHVPYIPVALFNAVMDIESYKVTARDVITNRKIYFCIANTTSTNTHHIRAILTALLEFLCI